VLSALIDGGSKHLLKVGQVERDYTAQYSRTSLSNVLKDSAI
jgi:hypothetical protein